MYKYPSRHTWHTGDPEQRYSVGTAGRDTLHGLRCNDIFIGGRGRDIVDGGKGYDFISYEGMRQPLKIDLEAGKTFVFREKPAVASDTPFFSEKELNTIGFSTTFSLQTGHIGAFFEPFDDDFQHSIGLPSARALSFSQREVVKDKISNIEVSLEETDQTGFPAMHFPTSWRAEMDAISWSVVEGDRFMYVKPPSNARDDMTDAILDFNRDEGDAIELAPLARHAGVSLTFVETSSATSGIPYSVFYKKGVNLHETALYGDPRFEDDEGHPLFKGDDGLSLMMDLSGDGRSDFMIAVWGADDIRASDLVL